MYTKQQFISKYENFKAKYEKADSYEQTELCAILDKNLSDKSYPPDLKENIAKYQEMRKKTSPNRRSFHNYSLFYH